MLGVGVFGSVRAGLWLWLIHIAAALLTGLLLRGLGHGPPQRSAGYFLSVPSLSDAFVSAVQDSPQRDAVRLRVRDALFTCWPRRCGPARTMAALAVGVTELFSLTPLLHCDRMGFVLAAGCAGWGGLSVLCQTAAVLDGTDLPLRPVFWQADAGAPLRRAGGPSFLWLL